MADFQFLVDPLGCSLGVEATCCVCVFFRRWSLVSTTWFGEGSEIRVEFVEPSGEVVDSLVSVVEMSSGLLILLGQFLN